MRPRSSLLRSRVCLGGEAWQAAGGPAPLPGKRTWAADACRAEPPISRPRPPRDGSGFGFGCDIRPTARTAMRRRYGGATGRQRRYRALNRWLPLRQANRQYGPPIPSAPTPQGSDKSLHRPIRMPTSANSYGFSSALTPGLPPVYSHGKKEVGVKSYLRRVAARTVEALEQALASALDSITAQDAASFFRHGGYACPN
jgi:hypothetical protein